MRVPTITNDQASIAWNALNDHDVFENVSELVIDYVGDETEPVFSDLDFSNFADELATIKMKYDGKNKKIIGGLIDSDIVEPIHRTLHSAGIEPYQLCNLGFWRWMSNVACDGDFWRFISWRYGSDIQQNWGITSVSSMIEVYFYRAWLRAHKMYSPDESDPYFYARIGSSDVWRSHILRQDFGRDKEFVKALLDTIYGQNGKTLVGTEELRTKLVPALRAWSSNSSFSHLTYSENLELIKTLRIEVG